MVRGVSIQPLKTFTSTDTKIVLTDIDGTLTEAGRISARTYESLEKLSRAGFRVIPVTGRPAGWCELIARTWPVDGVIGENGAFYFRLGGTPARMRRFFARDRRLRREDRARLAEVRRAVLARVPGTKVSSDQFGRLFDLAIDFAEDVAPLGKPAIAQIVEIFADAGAVAKVSNIHVNGWFGTHDKVSTAKIYLEREFGYDEAMMKKHCVFVGDSPNDEPMFEFFPRACAVANIREFTNDLRHPPAFVTKADEGAGFVEVAETLLRLQPG